MSEPAVLRFAAACCRRAWHLTDDPRPRAVVEAAERLADGGITAAEFERILAPVVELWADLPPRGPEGVVPYKGWEPWRHMTAAARHLDGREEAPWAAVFAARAVARRSGAHGSEEWVAAWLAEIAAQRDLLVTFQRRA
jgi:hypothetical protein